MPAESVIERLKRRLTTEDPYPSEYIAVRVTEVKALLRVAEAAERAARNWKKCDAMQNPSLSDANHGNAIDDLCSAADALRAGGSDV